MNEITLIEHLSVDSLTEALQDAGYRFQFTDLDVALADVLAARRKDQA